MEPLKFDNLRGSYDVSVDSSFFDKDDSNSSSFVSLRYGFRPELLNENDTIKMDKQSSNTYSFENNNNNSDSKRIIKGQATQATDSECVLWFDPDTNSFKLYPLSTIVRLSTSRDKLTSSTSGSDEDNVNSTLLDTEPDSQRTASKSPAPISQAVEIIDPSNDTSTVVTPVSAPSVSTQTKTKTKTSKTPKTTKKKTTKKTKSTKSDTKESITDKVESLNITESPAPPTSLNNQNEPSSQPYIGSISDDESLEELANALEDSLEEELSDDNANNATQDAASSITQSVLSSSSSTLPTETNLSFKQQQEAFNNNSSSDEEEFPNAVEIVDRPKHTQNVTTTTFNPSTTVNNGGGPMSLKAFFGGGRARNRQEEEAELSSSDEE